MGDEFVRDLCDERHKNVEKVLVSIDTKIDTLFNRLNWFYLAAISALASGVSAVTILLIK